MRRDNCEKEREIDMKMPPFCVVVTSDLSFVDSLQAPFIQMHSSEQRNVILYQNFLRNGKIFAHYHCAMVNQNSKKLDERNIFIIISAFIV